MSHIFVTGISTEVGKTVASAVLTEALEADYWKPVQAGDLEDSDSHKIRRYLSNRKSTIHPNAYALNHPMSPHAAAALDQVSIDLSKITRPETTNHLVIEGAGGLLVPLNETDTIAGLINPSDKVLVVSRHYLGSINHSLLTLEYLLNGGWEPAVLFVGEPHPSTESIILSRTGVRMLGRLPILGAVNAANIRMLANQLRPELLHWVES